MMPTQRICFLILNNIHHIYHIAPILYEAGRLSGVQATAYCSSNTTYNMVSDLAEYYPGSEVQLRLVGTNWQRWVAKAKGRAFPRISKVLKKVKQDLFDFDAVVTPDFLPEKILSEAVKKTKVVRSYHGAGDRAYGTSLSVTPSLKKYDLFLLHGPKAERRLKKEGVLEHTEARVVGYPKLDIINWKRKSPLSSFNLKQPTILYAPHFDPKLTSWDKMGQSILEFFYTTKKYNLILAPHIMFAHDAHRLKIDQKYHQAENIHIDLNSTALIDMTYPLSADIFLGDVSSQVYEFLYQPRPAIFLNAHDIKNWENDQNYLHWSMGRVIDSVDELEDSLAKATEEHAEYKEIQERLVSDSFDRSEKPAGLRAAEAIRDFLTAG